MDKRLWNQKERSKKIAEIGDRETILRLSIRQCFITDNGFIVIFWNNIIDIIIAYYVDKNYNDTEIGEYSVDDKNIFEKIEKFRFEIEGEMR